MSDTDIPPVPDNIIKISDFVERTYRPKTCSHSRFLVDSNNKIIECKDCGEKVEAFEAMLALADKTSEYQMQYEKMIKDHRNLANYTPHLRDVRELEGIWRGKMLPCCPNCNRGLTARELLSGGSINKVFQEARDKHNREKEKFND